MRRDDLLRKAREAAIKEVVEAHWPEFERRYNIHADRLEVSRRWHLLK